MVVDDIYWLDQIQPSLRHLVGDKAFHLGLLLQRHYPVIPGVVVAVPVLREFLSHVDWQQQMFAELSHSFLYVDTGNSRQLQTVAQQIRRAIQATPLPETLLSALETKVQQWQTVILRPSFALQSGLDPTVSYKTTGLFASHLCRTDRNSLAQGLKQAWSELFRARSLFYWQRLGIQLQHVQLAVLVQPIDSVQASGDLLIRGNQLQIRSVWGLGHALSQGQFERCFWNLAAGLERHESSRQTYAYSLGRADPLQQSDWLSEAEAGLQLDWVEAQSDSVLSQQQLTQLAQLAQQVQTEMGMPLALEWTLDAAGFHLVQVTPQFSSSHPGLRLPIAASKVAPSQADQRSTDWLRGLAAAPGRATATAWVLSANADLTKVPAGVIVVAAMITPEQMIRLRQAAGVVTEQGGLTSHAAILARELGIPAVVGVERATQIIATGEQLTLDGNQGEVHRGEVHSTRSGLAPSGLATPEPAISEPSAPSIEPTAPQQIPLPTPLLSDRTAAQTAAQTSATQLWVSLSQLDHLSQIAALPIDGVGLLRSELMLLDLFAADHPEVWFRQQSLTEAVEQIANRIGQFAAAFAPRPVFYRSLDLRSHEFSRGTGGSMLGLRGTLSYQQNPDLFRVQLLALRQLRQQGYDNVSLLLPFVRTVEEFVFCRQQVEQVGLLEAPFQLWIMAEVPSVLLLLADYVAAGVQGIAIGMNDLTQLLLGVDRDHPQLAAAFNPEHPAVRRAVRQLIETAQQLGIPQSICGHSLRQSELLSELLAWGITAISVDPSEVESLVESLLKSGL